jgi:hypothetical protein
MYVIIHTFAGSDNPLPSIVETTARSFDTVESAIRSLLDYCHDADSEEWQFDEELTGMSFADMIAAQRCGGCVLRLFDSRYYILKVA